MSRCGAAGFPALVLLASGAGEGGGFGRCAGQSGAGGAGAMPA